jgi:hypothetical protein
MPRSQQWTDASCYHLLNRGHNRDTLFHDDDDRTYFCSCSIATANASGSASTTIA